MPSTLENGSLKDISHIVRAPNVQKYCEWDQHVCDYKDKKDRWAYNTKIVFNP